MAAIIHALGRQFEVEMVEQTILEVLQALEIDVSAPCGGRGTCKKCQVLVRDSTGLHYVLACQTPLEEAMEVFIEDRKPMVIQHEGEGLRGFDFGDYMLDDRSGYGIAVDIGTTTMVARLHEVSSGALLAVESRVNPQVVYGSDVIARITASMEGKLDAMTDLVRGALDEMVDDLCAEIGINRTEVVDVALVGNTVIQHLVARLSPDQIGVSPFEPLSYFGESRELEPVNKQSYFAPVLSGYIGGDVTAGILACGMDRTDHKQVYLDLGTNGELAVGNRDRLICCATAAGPVFEGANVRCGMTAQPGAISEVRFKDGELEVSVIGDIEPVGVCGTGLIEAVAGMLEAGVVDETGRLLDEDESDPKWISYLAEVDNEHVFYLDPGRTVFIAQKDIRNLQLAKAAICAGIYTLLEAHGLKIDEVDDLLVAGGFGSFLNIDAAAAVGLFPQELRDRAKSVGNMAAEGASLLLLSQEARARIQAVCAESEYIELSTHAVFNTFYMDCMAFEEAE